MLCNGGEKSIEFCKSRGWGNSDCTHDEDAGVVCKDERIPGFVDSNVIDVSCQVGAFFSSANVGFRIHHKAAATTLSNIAPGPHSLLVVTHVSTILAKVP